MACGCSTCASPCAKCCTVTSTFWMFMLGIIAAFGIMALVFLMAPDKIAQMTSNAGGVYTFRASLLGGGGVDVFKDGVIVPGAGGAVMAFQTQAAADEFLTATCRGTILLWLLLAGGFGLATFLLYRITGAPDQFVCCSLRPQLEAMQQQMADPVPGNGEGEPPMPKNNPPAEAAAPAADPAGAPAAAAEKAAAPAMA